MDSHKDLTPGSKVASLVRMSCNAATTEIYQDMSLWQEYLISKPVWMNLLLEEVYTVLKNIDIWNESIYKLNKYLPPRDEAFFRRIRPPRESRSLQAEWIQTIRGTMHTPEYQKLVRRFSERHEEQRSFDLYFNSHVLKAPGPHEELRLCIPTDIAGENLPVATKEITPIAHIISSQLLLHNIVRAFGMLPDHTNNPYYTAWHFDIFFLDASRLRIYEYSGSPRAIFHGNAATKDQALGVLNYLINVPAEQEGQGEEDIVAAPNIAQLCPRLTITGEHLRLISKVTDAPSHAVSIRDKKDAISLYARMQNIRRHSHVLQKCIPPLDRAVFVNRKQAPSLAEWLSHDCHLQHSPMEMFRSIRQNFKVVQEAKKVTGLLTETVRWDTDTFPEFDERGDQILAGQDGILGTASLLPNPHFGAFMWPLENGRNYKLGGLISAHLLFYRLLASLDGIERVEKPRSGFVWEITLEDASTDAGYLCFTADFNQPRAIFHGTEDFSHLALRFLGYLTSMYCRHNGYEESNVVAGMRV